MTHTGPAGFWQADRPAGYASRRWPTPPALAIYEHFRRGEFGDLGGQEAPAGSFTGQNVIVTRDGRLVPRCGWMDVSPAGAAAGVVAGFAFIGSSGRELHYIQGTNILRAAAGGGGAPVSEGTIAITPTKPADFFTQAGIIYWTIFGDKTYRTDVLAGTTAALTGSPGGRCVCIYGDRMIVGGLSGFPQRIRISAAADFNSWPSTNIIDFGGDAWEIRALLPMRNFLVVVRQDMSIYILTGAADGTGATRRQVGFPKGGQGGAVMWPGRVTLDLSSQMMWGVAQHKIVPVMFNGAKFQDMPDIRFGGPNIDQGDTPLPVYGATFGAERDECLLMDRAEQTFALRKQGTWTKHTYNNAKLFLSGYVQSDGSNAVYACDGGSAGVVPKFYRLSINELETPPINSGGVFGLVRAGDGTDGVNQTFQSTVTFPDWYAAFAFEVLVRYVIVDFEVFTAGSGSTFTNHFDVIVTALDVNDNTSGTADSKTFDAAQSGGATGTRMSRRFAFASQGWGRGFRVALDNMRGVKIRRVSVYGMLEPERLE